MRIGRSLTLGIFILVSACASTAPPSATIKNLHFPDREVANTASLGDTLLSYVKVSFLPSIESKQNISLPGSQWPAQVWRPIGQQGKWLKILGEGQGLTAAGYICYSEENGFCQPGGMGCTDLGYNCGGKNVEVAPADFIEASLPQFKQELIYNGRSGDTVKFLYRELSNSVMRDAFTQEVHYDLSQGNEIGFKKARLLVIEATNSQVTYKVLSSFSDDG